MTINWNRRSYTEEEFTEAWNSSESIAEVLRKLDLNLHGSSYSTMKGTASDLGLSTDHMVGQGWNINGRFQPSKPRPLEDRLVKSNKKPAANTKSRLIREGFLPNECSAPYCPVPNPTVDPFTGEEAELKLALDHINGDNTDNRIENLRLLCYHCHGMTDTWCVGHGAKTKKTMVKNPRRECDCGASKGVKALRCKACDIESRRRID